MKSWDYAKKELDEVSPYTCEYTPLKTVRKITAIKFYPVYQPEPVSYTHLDVYKRQNQNIVIAIWKNTTFKNRQL